MKDCKKIHPLLSPYLDGSLSSRESAQVTAHLKDCPDARQELENLKRLREVMVALPEPKPPHDLHQRIMAKIQGHPLPLPRRPFWILPAGAMALAAVVAVFLFVQNPGLMDFSRQKQSRFSTEQSNMVAANKPMTQAAGYSKPSTEKTTLNYNESFAPSQPQSITAGLAKDQKTNPAPVVQLASLPRAKESRASKKALEVEGTINKVSSTEVNAGPSADGRVLGLPSSTNTFTGSTTVDQTFANKAVDADINLSNARSYVPDAQAPAPAVAGAAPPAAAPAPVTSWSGSFDLAPSETQELVTDDAVFQKFWQTLRPGQTPPGVDFTTQAVVVLMDQERPTAGYSIHITSLEDKPDQLVIHYQVQAPAPGSFAAQILTRPWALQIIPKPTKPVVFQKD